MCTIPTSNKKHESICTTPIFGKWKSFRSVSAPNKNRGCKGKEGKKTLVDSIKQYSETSDAAALSNTSYNLFIYTCTPRASSPA